MLEGIVTLLPRILFYARRSHSTCMVVSEPLVYALGNAEVLVNALTIHRLQSVSASVPILVSFSCIPAYDSPPKKPR